MCALVIREKCPREKDLAKELKFFVPDMQPLCQVHFDKYKDILQLIDITRWPEEFVNARMTYPCSVKETNIRLIAQLEKGSERLEVEAKTKALVGRSFKGVNFLKASEIVG